jgi:hypothetical protein
MQATALVGPTRDRLLAVDRRVEMPALAGVFELGASNDLTSADPVVHT